MNASNSGTAGKVDPIGAILFDKDGTLFDFQATWGAWTAGFLRELGGPIGRTEALAEAIGYDMEAERHHPDSPVIAGTLDVWAELMLGALPGEYDHDTLKRRIADSTATARQVPAAPLPALLEGLKARGYRLGVATNDGIAPVSRHLSEAEVDHLFDFVAGYDSGYGSKPEPGMLLAFCEAVGVAPERTLMVGDSRHDLDAAAAAGMRRVAVLTGHATREELAPHAEAVLGTIGELPAWLEAQSAP